MARDVDKSTGGGRAALASSLVPGWGQAIRGKARMARIMLVVDLVLATVAIVAVVWFQIDLAVAWVTPAALWGLFALNALVLIYRGAATVDAFRGTSNGLFDWSALMVAAAIVVVPHLFSGAVALTQYDLITTVFASEEPQAAIAATTTTKPSTDTTIVAGLESTTTIEPSTTITLPEPTIWDGKERLNVLLLGSDAGEGRIGTRTDTMILVSIEPEKGEVAMFSIPRNLSAAPLPEGMGLWSCNCFPDILTHLWANGEWYPDAFPGPQEPWINALKGAVGLIFDLEVHYYAKADLKGFVGVVDALGGVTISVPETIRDATYPHEDGGTESVVIEEGLQFLDGHRALAYARIRRHSGDFARMHRQRCVLGALVRQTGPLDFLTGFGELATAIKNHVVTDIPVDRLPDFVKLLPKIDTDEVATLRITRYNYGAGGHPGQQFYDLDQIRADAHALLADPDLAIDTLDGVGLDETCEESFG